MLCVSGAVLNALLAKLLKRLLKEERPAERATDPSEAFPQVPLWLPTSFIAALRSGLTPDDLAPRSEVVEGTESFL